MTVTTVDATPELRKMTTPDANTKLLEAQREIISRSRLKPFTKRTDRHGLMYFGGHMSIIFGTGYLVYLATGTGWLIPAMFLHGVMLGHLFAPMHETSHGTASALAGLTRQCIGSPGS